MRRRGNLELSTAAPRTPMRPWTPLHRTSLQRIMLCGLMMVYVRSVVYCPQSGEQRDVSLLAWFTERLAIQALKKQKYLLSIYVCWLLNGLWPLSSFSYASREERFLENGHAARVRESLCIIARPVHMQASTALKSLQSN